MFEIRRPDIDEVDVAVGVLADGFQADPVFSWAFPDCRIRPAALTALFGVLVGEALLSLGATYLRGAESCAVWVPPGSPDPWQQPGFAESFVGRLADIASADVFDRLQVLGERTEAVHPTEPHYYLALLATRTESQGRGAGSTLLQHTLADVDGRKLPAYLESSNAANVTLYQRHGFDVTGRIDLPEGPSLLTMWRPAST